MSRARGTLALVALFVGIGLGAWALVASTIHLNGMRWVATWLTVGSGGATLLISGIGLWMSRRWAAYLLAAVSVAAAATALVVAPGVILRSVRVAFGGPVLPLFVAVGSLVIGGSAFGLATRMKVQRLPPLTGPGVALIGGIGGAIEGVALWLLLRDAIGGDFSLPSLAVSVVYAGVGASVGAILLALALHTWHTSRAWWPAGLAAAALALTVGFTAMVLPIFLLGSDAHPLVLDGRGGSAPLHEVIPGGSKGGASLAVSLTDTHVLLGMEGYVVFVKAVSERGDVLLDQRTGVDGITASLPPGNYRFTAYYRNCDANCGYLDPPSDFCSTDISLVTDLPRMIVVSIAQRTCTTT